MKLVLAARRGKIQIIEQTVEQRGPNSVYVVVRFKPLR